MLYDNLINMIIQVAIIIFGIWLFRDTVQPTDPTARLINVLSLYHLNCSPKYYHLTSIGPLVYSQKPTTPKCMRRFI